METLDAYEGFDKRGKSLMYTGGNGFYVSSSPLLACMAALKSNTLANLWLQSK